MTVSRVDIHHEGGGVPSSNLDRFAYGGYVLGIGGGQWKIFRRAVDNWATAHFNHVDVAVCFSGDRMTYPITDDDLRCLREAMAQERANGEVVDHPDVHPHGTLYTAPGGNLPGSSPTQCPGLLTLQRWPEIVAACQADAPVPAPPPKPVPPVVKEEPMLIPSPKQVTPNRFDGVKVDFATQTIANRGAGVCAPNPSAIGGKPWDGAYVVDGGIQPDGFRHFVVVTTDTDTYEFHVK